MASHNLERGPELSDRDGIYGQSRASERYGNPWQTLPPQRHRSKIIVERLIGSIRRDRI